MTKSIIYKLRKYKNISRKELSVLTNISDYRLRQLEETIDHIKIDEIIKISNVLDCSINDLSNLFNILNSFNKNNISELDKHMLKDARKIIDDLLE